MLFIMEYSGFINFLGMALLELLREPESLEILVGHILCRPISILFSLTVKYNLFPCLFIDIRTTFYL